VVQDAAFDKSSENSTCDCKYETTTNIIKLNEVPVIQIDKIYTLLINDNRVLKDFYCQIIQTGGGRRKIGNADLCRL
jgi:hypothetical protein